MKKNFISPDNEGKLVLKSVKLTEPLVKPEIKEAVIPAEVHTSGSSKKSIFKKLIDQLKKIKI
ncbi:MULTISPECIES: hypothetical protein [Chryseobacterium]|jgi:hypothetical protein|uniref:Uncharacterized protein n=1 Tax=Chryseobacterium geocarposphaerae TaxID=1416776 RepID=A0ABU1L936_9FLAO|nr:MULTISPECIES: hypothetical protein [Chryseobacterium]ALR30041.1 hypothetical protein ATE47_05660 [Chryseobacterium sp. IHB B 17019]MDR6403222.1 hypothetical protein [Chryseobacterium geocarposphaerae]